MHRFHTSKQFASIYL